MARTTITLKDEVFKSLGKLAEKENRSTPNLIETILMRYLEEEFLVDETEMAEIRHDEELNRDIKKGLADYKSGKGRFV